MSRSRAARRRAATLHKAASKALVPTDYRTAGQTGSGGTPAVSPFPLFDALQVASGAALLGTIVNPFPRDPRDNNAFGPGQPLDPAPLDAPDPVTGQPAPRVWQYPVSWNLPGNGGREVPWQVLRTASTAVDIIRRCIRYRQKTLRGLKWKWSVTADAIQEAYESNPEAGREDAEQTLRAQYAEDIKRLTQWWRKPWGQNGLKMGQWLNMLLEEHLVLDAVAIYPRRALSGDVLDFQILDGSTVKPLLDVQGATPCPPWPAFQQELYGFARGEYGQAYTDQEVTQDNGQKVIQRTVSDGMTTAQLFYHRENVRANSPYGLSSVEQALIAARLYLKRQGWMLAEYDDGSTPVTWITPSEDEQAKSGQAFTPAIRRAWEDGFNDEFGGSTRRRHRAKVLPPGWTPTQTQSVDERYKPDYDLHLIKLLCGFFDVPITELGFSEAKGIGNSGLHEGMADVAAKVGDKPDVEIVAEIITDLARTFQGCPPELEIQFIDPKSDDGLEKDQADDLAFKGAQKTLNDVRRSKGLPTYSFAEADMPMLVGVGPTGVLFLEGLHEQQQADRQAQLALTQSQMEAGLVQEDGTPAGSSPPGAQPAPDAAGQASGTDTAKLVSAELTAFRRWRARNPNPARPFRFKAATPDDVMSTTVLSGIERIPDPNLMEFEGWHWEPDLDKGAGWDPGVKRFRDTRGRFVKGSMAGDVLDALEDAGHKVVRHPDHPRAARLSRMHDEHLDAVVSRLQSGKRVKRGESQLTDDLERHGLLAEAPGGRGRLELSDAGREHIKARAPEDYRGQAPLQPEPSSALYIPVPGETAARERQGRVDRARAMASVAAEMHELGHDGHTVAEMRARARSAADRAPEMEHVGGLATVIEGESTPEAIRAAADRWATEHGLTQVGTPGELVHYDPKEHHAPDWMQRDMRAEGRTQMEIVRPGYRWTDPVSGDDVRLSKPSVDFPLEPQHRDVPEADPEAVRATETSAQRLDRIQRGELTPFERAEQERMRTEAQAIETEMNARRARQAAAREASVAATGMTPAQREIMADLEGRRSDAAFEAEMAGKPAPVFKPVSGVENAAGQGFADRVRQAEAMYGTDRSRWPEQARRDMAKLELKEAARRKREARLRPADVQEAQHRDLTPAAPVELPHDQSSGTVEPMASTSHSKLSPAQADSLASALLDRESGQIGGGNARTLEILASHGLVRKDEKFRYVITEDGRNHPALSDPATLKRLRGRLVESITRSNDRMASRTASGKLSNDELAEEHENLLVALADVDDRLGMADSRSSAAAPDTSMPQGTGAGAGTPVAASRKPRLTRAAREAKDAELKTGVDELLGRTPAAAPGFLTREQVDALSEERDRLSRMNSIDRRATNPPEDVIGERTRRLGQIQRQLKKHYAERDRLQAAGQMVSYADDLGKA